MGGAQDRGARDQYCLGDFQNESQGFEVCSSFPFLSEVEGMRQAERTKWRGKYASKYNSSRTHAKCLLWLWTFP